MRRTTLMLIIVLILIILGGGAYLTYTKTKIVFPWVNKATTTTTNNGVTTTTNTVNTSLKTITLPTEVKGDTAVTGKLKIDTIELTISSQQKQTTIGAETADKGMTFLLVYFDPVAPTDVLAVDKGLRQVKVNDGKADYPVAGISVSSTTVKGGRGYMKFVIPTTATNLKLQLGTGATLQSVTLP